MSRPGKGKKAKPKKGSHVKRNAPSLRMTEAERARRLREERAASKERARREREEASKNFRMDFYDHAVNVDSENAEILTEPCARVDDVSEVAVIVAELKWMTEHDDQCAGIAAPQRGYAVRIFTMQPRGEATATVWINPEIEPTGSALRIAEWEGCFSLRGKKAHVERWTAVVLSGLDENGEQRSVKLAGWPARIAQHEIDHLNGVLIRDHAELADIRSAAWEREPVQIVEASELREELAKRG